jgi:hypothetical protein
MTDIAAQLEFLPSEILIYIFQYFDARDLFRAFYHLNSRFNALLQSLNYLSLTLLKFDSNQINNYEIFAPYIYTLKMDYAVNIDLKHFTNLHRLILLSPTSNQLQQAVVNSLPHLEHLSIGYEHFLFSNYIPDLCLKIFSNKFPRLTSCYLYEPRILEIIPNLTQSIQIRRLKMDNIDIFTYKDILSLCPNLYFFQFTILNQQEEFCQIKAHFHLKQMIIKFQNLVQTFSDSVIMSYLSCVPNLEQLTIYEINFDVNIKEYLQYNWFASVIVHHLLLLNQFKYYLYIYGMKENDEDVINDIQRNFKYIQKDRYQSRLVLYLS